MANGQKCAERFYGIKPGSEDDEDDNEDDIEASIQKEIAAMGDKQGKIKLFSPVHLDIPCVLFFKTRHPIDPIDFVYRICKEIVAKPGVRRMKYVNRLTPMTLMAKATEKGLEDLGRTVLRKHFNLAVESDEGQAAAEEGPKGETGGPIPNHSVSR